MSTSFVSNASSAVILAAEGNPSGGMFTMLMPLLLIGMLFYFMLIRPEKRKQADVQRMQQGLKKNDRVLTIGGIIGVVVNTQQGSDEVTLRVDDTTNTRLRVVRSAISRILSADKEGKSEDSPAETKDK
jgi:preprotein translocase subunit YajC